MRRVALLLLVSLTASAGLAAAEDVVVTPAGDAAASVLAITGQGNAFCGGTQCVAASGDGNAGCYGPYCAALAEGDTTCHALFCAATSVYGNSSASSRPHNQFENVLVAASLFGNAYSDGYTSNDVDVALSGTGDASTENGVAVSLFGHATARRNGFAVSGCDTLAELCLDA